MEAVFERVNERLTNFLLEYNNFMNKEKDFNPKNSALSCFCCGKKIEVLPGFPENEKTGTPFPWIQTCLDNATVGMITSGYGSKHDLDRRIIGICDDCLTLHHSRTILVDENTF
jgi:hypothetical protein